MHYIVLMRGIKNAVDEVVDGLSKIMLPMWMALPNLPGTPAPEVSGAAVQPIMNMVQVAVRPVQLYEIVFPREHEDLMAATLFGEQGQTNEKWMSKWFNLLRRLLHLQPINWNFRKTPFIPLPKKEFVEIIGIGKKDDSYIKTEKEEHENL